MIALSIDVLPSHCSVEMKVVENPDSRGFVRVRFRAVEHPRYRSGRFRRRIYRWSAISIVPENAAVALRWDDLVALGRIDERTAEW